MTIKHVKDFLEQFDDDEEIVMLEFETETDMCRECNEYHYDDYYDDCVWIEDCAKCKKHNNYKYLALAFKSDVREDGTIYEKDIHGIVVKDQD